MATKYPQILLTSALAASGDKTIPPATASSAGTGRFSQALGFPPETAKSLIDGGVPPKREDFNGAFNLLSQYALWYQQGGLMNYSATLSYEVGNEVLSGGTKYRCIKAVKGTAPPNATYWKSVDVPSGIVFSVNDIKPNASGNVSLGTLVKTINNTAPDANGNINTEQYSLKPATASVLGGIKVGQYLTVTSAGVLSASPVVTQTATSTNAEYPILTKNTNGTATAVDASRFSSAITLNPYTKTITASNFNGTATKATGDKNGLEFTANYVRIAGAQTITGNKTFAGTATFEKGIRFTQDDTTQGILNTVLSSPSGLNSVNVRLGYGGSTYITSGEASGKITEDNGFSASAENVQVMSDANIYLRPNLDKGWDATKGVWITSSAIAPISTGKSALGSPNYRWSNLYTGGLNASGSGTIAGSLTVSGTITGNVTGNLTGLASKATADGNGNNIASTYAKDSAVVHLAGSETITGSKTFSNTSGIVLSNSVPASGTAPSGNANRQVLWKDSAGQTYVNVQGRITTSGTTELRFRMRKWGDTATADTGLPTALCLYQDASGTPWTYAPTPASGDSSGKIATTQWVQNNSLRITESGKTASSWYRVYSDGFIEQGGWLTTAQSEHAVTFPKPFSTLTFSAMAISYDLSDGKRSTSIKGTPTKTAVVFISGEGGKGTQAYKKIWFACGY